MKAEGVVVAGEEQSAAKIRVDQSLILMFPVSRQQQRLLQVQVFVEQKKKPLLELSFVILTIIQEWTYLLLKCQINYDKQLVGE